MITSEAVHALLWLEDKSPEPEDVKAGWTAFVIFLLLIAAVALLGLSLFRHLRKAEAAEEAGAFGRKPGSDAEAEPERHSTS